MAQPSKGLAVCDIMIGTQADNQWRQKQLQAEERIAQVQGSCLVLATKSIRGSTRLDNMLMAVWSRWTLIISLKLWLPYLII